MEADDQAIQIILMGLPEDIYAAVDSCETTQEILRVQQMMKGSDIGIQDKKAKLFNEWERFTSTDGESIESYYHRFSKLMNDFKRNKHFPEKIASNLKQIAQLDMNMGQDRQMQMVKGNGGNQLKQYAGQNVGNQNWYNAVQNVGNQNPNGNGNVVAARAEGNAIGNNGNQIRCYNYRGLGHLVKNCTVRPRRRDAAYLQTQLLIAQKEEAGIQLQAEEFDLMAATVDLKEIVEVNANCILMANLQRASTSGTQTDKAPVYDRRIQLSTHYGETTAMIMRIFKYVYSTRNSILATRKPSRTHQYNRMIVMYFLKSLDPPAVHDSEETLQLAQESHLKMKQLNKEIKPANYTKINHLLGVFVSQTAKSQEEVYFLNTSKTATVSKSISIPNEEFLDDTTPSVARKFLNESIAHQEIHKILKEENFPIINQVDTRLQNFEIQFLKEAAKFVRDFKSLAKEADESLAKHKALELEIERLLRAVVRVDNTAKTRRPQPRSNTKNDRVPSASKSSCIKNKEVEVEEHPRNLLLSKNKKHMSSELKINPKEYFDSVASLTKHLLSEHLNKMEYGTKKSDRALCYPKNDREDIGKLGAKGDIVFSIVILLIPVLTDTKPGLQSKTLDTSVSRGLDLTYAPSTITTQQPAKRELDLLFRSDV
ncbi:hypothetical protein Tco_1217754 [Tanacetum coccineum]